MDLGPEPRILQNFIFAENLKSTTYIRPVFDVIIYLILDYFLMKIEMGDDRENMINFVQGLLDTMPLGCSPLSTWKNQEIRQEYCKTYNKTSLTTEQSQLLRNVVQEVAELAASSEIAKVKHWKKIIKKKYEKEELLAKEENGGNDELGETKGGGKMSSPFFGLL